VQSPREPADPRAPPLDLDDLIDWFDRLGFDLVHLAEYPVEDLDRALTEFERAVRSHLAGGQSPSNEDSERLGTDRARTLESEHARFLTSLEQLRWHFRIVEHDDHGGHRQALGQYIRVVAEALRRHREDERPVGRGSRTTSTSSPRVGQS